MFKNKLDLTLDLIGKISTCKTGTPKKWPSKKPLSKS